MQYLVTLLLQHMCASRLVVPVALPARVIVVPSEGTLFDSQFHILVHVVLCVCRLCVVYIHDGVYMCVSVIVGV